MGSLEIQLELHRSTPPGTDALGVKEPSPVVHEDGWKEARVRAVWERDAWMDRVEVGEVERSGPMGSILCC